jgi:hypothetical protein
MQFPESISNGLLLLQELTKTYKPTNVPEMIAAKTVEFWGHTKRQSQESIDQYYDRFHELLDDLQDADEPISTRSAIRQFIFTLGPEFEPIQNNFRVKVLPSEWYQEDWPTILALCRDYYNSVKPQGLLRKEMSETSSNDRLAHQKKIRDWWMNPDKFCKQIENEQKTHTGKCLYHLTKSHQSSNCAVKKECDRLLALKKNGDSSGGSNSTRSGPNPAGQLCHLTEVVDEVIDETVEDTSDDCFSKEVANDTNDEILNYFSHVSKHYLRLAKHNSDSSSRQNMAFPIIADSGANWHMFNNLSFFDDIQPS